MPNKAVVCVSGLKGWQGKLQDQYRDFAEFEDCDEIFGLAERLGFNNAQEAWEINPTVMGSTNPADFQIAPDEFYYAYVTAAFWSSNDESDERGGEPLDKNYSNEDLAPEAEKKMLVDCARFVHRYGIPDYGAPYSGQHYDAGNNVERAGHDFWLTRNGHGAGFWDRSELSQEDQDKYTEGAKSFGECDLYVGDDKKVYVS